jgi:hypothetical protein
MFNFKRFKNIEFTLADRESFTVILTKLINILDENNFTAQTKVVNALISLLIQQKDKEFSKLINGVDMWGGAGAVWEIYIEDSNIAREFEIEIVKLIDLMEKTNVLGRGIKPIRKIFKNNIIGKS